MALISWVDSMPNYKPDSPVKREFCSPKTDDGCNFSKELSCCVDDYTVAICEDPNTRFNFNPKWSMRTCTGLTKCALERGLGNHC